MAKAPPNKAAAPTAPVAMGAATALELDAAPPVLAEPCAALVVVGVAITEVKGTLEAAVVTPEKAPLAELLPLLELAVALWAAVLLGLRTLVSLVSVA